MKCQFCNKSEATVLVKQVIDGDVREFSVCAACAEEAGITAPLSVTDFLFGMQAPKADENDSGRSCPSCHMRSSDFNKTSRLGCAECYETFADMLAPIIDDMHKGTEHCGRVPASEKLRADAVLLNRELDAAVERQDFERAAELRDQIQAIAPTLAEEVADDC